jgi:hypothetical protein
VAKQTKEFKVYQILEHWNKVKKILPASQLFDKDDKYYPLYSYLYEKTKKLYTKLPQRKNGENPLIHPTNVILSLRSAGVKDCVTISSGLIHDYVEELVDLHKVEKNLKEDKAGVQILDKYEEEMFIKLEQELKEFCGKNDFPGQQIKDIIAVTKLLTRHKRDFYYRSMCDIFTCADDKLKERAILIKLADRRHNIVTIDSFSEQRRIYQCFKNLFILNSAKKYIIEKYGAEIFVNSNDPPIELLFKSCAKATYHAFLTICGMTNLKWEVKSIMQLAFKKFALEESGTRKVTTFDKTDIHPIRLYKGIIYKYDFRLRHKWKDFEKFKDDEIKYCTKFFTIYDLTDKEIEAILDYKDAYALKEVIAYMLYLPDYFLAGFEYSDLFIDE